MALVAGVVLVADLSWSLMTRVKEPSYSVQMKDGDFEVRTYGPRVVAETVVQGGWDASGNEGFRCLAGYIFGKNAKRAKIAMTAPVAQRTESRKIAMTAPVGHPPPLALVVPPACAPTIAMLARHLCTGCFPGKTSSRWSFSRRQPRISEPTPGDDRERSRAVEPPGSIGRDFWLTHGTQNGTVRRARSRCGSFGCAGSQLDFPAQQLQEVAEVWVPFEESIVVGWT